MINSAVASLRGLLIALGRAASLGEEFKRNKIKEEEIASFGNSSLLFSSPLLPDYGNKMQRVSSSLPYSVGLQNISSKFGVLSPSESLSTSSLHPYSYTSPVLPFSLSASSHVAILRFLTITASLLKKQQKFFTNWAFKGLPSYFPLKLFLFFLFFIFYLDLLPLVGFLLVHSFSVLWQRVSIHQMLCLW
jgi:hypothetical protein